MAIPEHARQFQIHAATSHSNGLTNCKEPEGNTYAPGSYEEHNAQLLQIVFLLEPNE
jgi:hypothetical protein